jgi:VanZ family protein
VRLRSALLWIAFAALVAYLSFVPFRYQPLEFDEALARFEKIPYLNLGAGSRADWVANILMFLPLGWLGAAFFVPRPRRRFDLVAILPSLALGAAWAAAVEFGQLYFPNRTVSINDIVAEVIGTFLGACLWSAFGATSVDWWRTLLRGGRATANAALGAYLLAYLVLSFSPFDFVISADELAQKIQSDLNGWWMAPISCGRAPCSLKLAVEALAVVPFGWWLGMRQGGRGGSIAMAAMVGASMGVLIELAQFLLVSGTSQGASIVSRAAGVAAGAWLHSSRDRILRIDWVRWGRPMVLAGLIPWLAVVAYVAGWFGGRWLGLEAGLARIAGVEWMPFFYQYYSTEQALIRSTLIHLVLYAPMGVAVWLWGRRTNTASGLAAALLAAMVAVVAESGKLFIPGRHPDYTDVLLAMAAASAAATLMRWMSSATITVAGPREVRPSPHRVAPLPVEIPPVASNLVERERPPDVAAEPEDARFAGGLSDSWGARAAAAVVLLLMAVSLLRFPVWQVPLALGLAAYAGLLVRRPLAYLLVVPAVLPLLDLAPVSGRFFWDEFDLLLATTVGIRLLMAQPPRHAAPQLPKVGLALLALSVIASAAITLWPPAPLDANAFTNYLSPYNALRVSKGYLWGGVLLWLMWRDAAAGRDVSSRLQVGLGLGLLAAALGVFWERLLFVGVADLGAWFRAAGLVSATHVGGAYLEAMLVVLTPFALGLAATRRNAVIGAFWLGVALLGAAAVLLTLSRAAAAAWLIAVAAFAVLWWLGARVGATGAASGRWRFGTAAATVALGAAGALMIQSGDLRDRLVISGSDLAIRLAHWRDTLDLMRSDPLHVVLGMGLGSFPREFYLAQAVPLKLAAYRLDREPGGKAFLTLVGGRAMYLDQRVAAATGREVLLRGQIRASRERAALEVALCEKSFLASVRCDWASVPAATDWQRFEVRLKLPPSSHPPMGPGAPVSLSLHNPAFGTRIDVTELSLLDGAAEQLANGAFKQEMDRWLMYSDVHLAWRALNTPVQILFDQGLLGVLAWAALSFGIAAIKVRRTAEPVTAMCAAAVLGLVAVACFDTLLDAPRIVALVALVVAACAQNAAINGNRRIYLQSPLFPPKEDGWNLVISLKVNKKIKHGTGIAYW